MPYHRHEFPESLENDPQISWSEGPFGKGVFWKRDGDGKWGERELKILKTTPFHPQNSSYGTTVGVVWHQSRVSSLYSAGGRGIFAPYDPSFYDIKCDLLENKGQERKNLMAQTWPRSPQTSATSLRKNPDTIWRDATTVWKNRAFPSDGLRRYVCPFPRHQEDHNPQMPLKQGSNRLPKVMSRRCPFSSKTNPHLEIPGKSSVLTALTRIFRYPPPKPIGPKDWKKLNLETQDWNTLETLCSYKLGFLWVHFSPGRTVFL